ncbi:MAG: acyl-CoA mutase large subunit family protein, partial [Desulfobacula sp.]|nr:acyl-CoA mutase large subunit family protein [Desulfobacula sp.]
EIAYAFEIAKAYIDNVAQRGIKPEDFVGRFSFNFNVYGNLWEQIAKFRAARKLWAKMLKNEYGVTEKKKLFLRGLFGGGGSGLTKEQPENNIMRGAYYALGAALSGAQTTALCSFDEAYTIPTPRSALLSLRTLEMLMDEVGLRDTVDPLAGSYFIETLTLEMEEKIIEEMKEVQKWGGMVKSISNGFIQRKVSKQAYEFEKGLQSGEYRKVGLNPEGTPDSKKGQTEKTEAGAVELHEYNEEWAKKSKASLDEVRRTRNDKDVTDSLKALEKAARGSDNVMPHLVKCCHAYATVGEMAGVFRDTFGEWNEPEFY